MPEHIRFIYLSFLKPKGIIQDIDEIIYLIGNDLTTAEYFGFSKQDTEYFLYIMGLLNEYRM